MVAPNTPTVILVGKLVTLHNVGTPGTLTFSLKNSGGLIPTTLLYLQVPTQVSVVVASNGTFTVTLWGNDQILSPDDTYYTAEFSGAGGVRYFGKMVLEGGGTRDITSYFS